MTLSERLFADLRQDIIEGRYRPHQRLVESDLALQLDASRTPIRQVLQRLELEGLVESSRHGWVIRQYSEEDLLAMYDIRIGLEGYATRLAAERGSDEELMTLTKVHETLAAHEKLLSSGAGDEGDRKRFVAVHDEFHDMIVVATGNAELRKAIRNYREHPYNRRVAHTYTAAETANAAKSHVGILDAICVRDALKAEQLTRDHLSLSRSLTLDRLHRGM